MGVPVQSGVDTTGSSDDPARVLLAWHSHPFQRQGSRRLLAIAVVVGIPAALWFVYGPFYALLALAILGGSLLSFFLPTRYVLYVGGLESRFLGVNRRFTWDQFRSYYPDTHGVLLSPFLRPSRLENFRGFYLRFDGKRDDVMRIVSQRIQYSETKDASA